MAKRPTAKPLKEETSTTMVLRMARQKPTRTEVLDALCVVFNISRDRAEYALECMEALGHVVEVDGRIEVAK